MTHDDELDSPVMTRDADLLNACLDRLARGNRDDGHGLDPSLMATVDAVASLGEHEASHISDRDSVHHGWDALMATSRAADSVGWRDRGVKLGLVASPVGFPLPRPRPWPAGLASAVAAVLLMAIVASHYAGLPGGASTSTVMAAGSPTVDRTVTVEPTACLDMHATFFTTPRIAASETAPVSTRTVGSTAVACAGSRRNADGR